MTYFKSTTITDIHGFSAENTPMNQLIVAESYRLAGGAFSGSLVEPGFTTVVTANNGTSTLSEGVMALNVTGASSSADARTNSVSRYVSTNANFYRGTLRLNKLTETNNIRRWGARDILNQNGLYFVYQNGTFGICSKLKGVETIVSSGNFNGIVSTYVPDENFEIYKIYYTTTKAYFYAGNSLIHTLTAGSVPMCENRSFVTFASNINNASATGNCSMYSTAMSIARLGTSSTQSKFINLINAGTYVLKLSPSKIHKVVVNQKTATFLTLYDSGDASGTKIGTMDLSGGAVQGNAVGAYVYDVDTNIGLTAVLSGTSDVTVIYE